MIILHTCNIQHQCNVLLASQIALHDPHTRQKKRLPLVLSLSFGALQFGIDRVSELKTLG